MFPVSCVKNCRKNYGAGNRPKKKRGKNMFQSIHTLLEGQGYHRIETQDKNCIIYENIVQDTYQYIRFICQDAHILSVNILGKHTQNFGYDKNFYGTREQFDNSVLQILQYFFKYLENLFQVA
jgi:hypothetical protein